MEDYRSRVQITGKPGSGQVILYHSLKAWCNDKGISPDIEIVVGYPHDPSGIDEDARIVIVKDETLASSQYAYQMALTLTKNTGSTPYIYTTGERFNDVVAFDMLETNALFDANTRYVSWGGRASELRAFEQAWRRMPKRTSEDPLEASLGAWVNEQRKQFKRDKLELSQIAYLEEIPQWGWSYAEEVKAKTIIGMLEKQHKIDQRPNPLILDRTKNILITGPAGSGKTTVLAAMLETLPKSEAIVVFEDIPQLEFMLPEHKIVSLTKDRTISYTNTEYIAIDGITSYDDLDLVRHISSSSVPYLSVVNSPLDHVIAESAALFDYRLDVPGIANQIVGKRLS